MGQIHRVWTKSADAKRASRVGVASMLMAPRPSGWAVGAMGSRFSRGVDSKFGPLVAPREIVAFWEALTAVRDQLQHVVNVLPQRQKQESAYARQSLATQAVSHM